MIERIWIAAAGLSGAAAVSADAAARHLLANAPYRLDLVATAARYGLFHAAALLAVAALARRVPPAGGRLWLLIGGWCFLAGMVLFCGSLYLLAAGLGPDIARLTPIGGVLLIAGWVALLVAALSPGRAQ